MTPQVNSNPRRTERPTLQTALTAREPSYIPDDGHRRNRSTRFRVRWRWLVGVAVALGAPLAGYAAVVISGTLTSQAGNNGNPAVQQTVTATGTGTYSVGPLSGPQFANNSTRGAMIIGEQPSPYISAEATGSDTGVYAPNGGTTFVQASFTFDFDVLGPTNGIGVPLLFGGSTDGLITNTGDASRWNSAVGTRLEITSVGGVYNLTTVGPQSGTLADIYSSSVQDVRAAWGQMASAPVGYTSYSASFQYGATVLSGQFAPGTQVLKLATVIQGGTRGVSTPTGQPSSGTANSFLDASVQIDPAWLQSHPGYTLESSIGVSAVPEPGIVGLMLAGLGLLGVRRGRHVAWTIAGVAIGSSRTRSRPKAEARSGCVVARKAAGRLALAARASRST